MASIIGAFAGSLMLNRPAKKRTFDALKRTLHKDGQAVADRWRSAPENDKNHARMTHIIGIERWAQARLRDKLLGGPASEREYDTYRPAKQTPWGEIVPLFEATRADTLALIDELDAAGLGDATAPHNDWGNLTARAWMIYLNAHATMESKRIR